MPLVRRSLARSERASALEHRQAQERRLRALVVWAAARSPFYRAWFRQTGLRPRDIRGLDDLRLLPLIERGDLVERPDDFLAYPRPLVWAAHSSGTSGRPVTVYRTPGSSVFELAVLQRQWSWFGVPRTARSVVLRGSTFAAEPSAAGRVTKENPGAKQLLVSSFHLAPAYLSEILAALGRFSPTVVEGWPSSLTLLAALLRDAGRRIPVTAVITSSEAMTSGQTALLSEVFGGPIVDHYGQTERAVMAGACEQGGYHLFPEYGVTELLPVEGAPGQYEMVGTPLHNWGFPLLRYRTGDLVRRGPEELCACGRDFPRVSLVSGRVEDVCRRADGTPIPLAGTIVDDLTGLREVQLVQHRAGRFEIRMVPGVGFDREAVLRRARRNFELMAGPGQELAFTEWKTIPRPASGKLRPVLVLSDGFGPQQGDQAGESTAS
jgi:phenylacetate-CoA ligase